MLLAVPGARPPGSSTTTRTATRRSRTGPKAAARARPGAGDRRPAPRRQGTARRSPCRTAPGHGPRTEDGPPAPPRSAHRSPAPIHRRTHPRNPRPAETAPTGGNSGRIDKERTGGNRRHSRQAVNSPDHPATAPTPEQPTGPGTARRSTTKSHRNRPGPQRRQAARHRPTIHPNWSTWQPQQPPKPEKVTHQAGDGTGQPRTRPGQAGAGPGPDRGRTGAAPTPRRSDRTTGAGRAGRDHRDGTGR